MVGLLTVEITRDEAFSATGKAPIQRVLVGMQKGVENSERNKRNALVLELQIRGV